MPFNFPDKRKENKAEWHILKDKNNRGYDNSEEDIHNDVLGSYTGTPYDDLRPIQDVDDL